MYFYQCKKCGQVIPSYEIGYFSCCNEVMEEMKVHENEAGAEKHCPIWIKDGDKIEIIIGETLHPMSLEHSIQWILIEEEQGYQFYVLNKEEPKIKVISSFPIRNIYAYCNNHGLWKKAYINEFDN